MQVGSLVECINFCDGCCTINLKRVKVNPSIEIGEILTVDNIHQRILRTHYTDGRVVTTSPGKGLIFSEIDPAIHPVLNLPVGYPIENFREVQLPMTITIEEILHETA